MNRELLYQFLKSRNYYQIEFNINNIEHGYNVAICSSGLKFQSITQHGAVADISDPISILTKHRSAYPNINRVLIVLQN